MMTTHNRKLFERCIAYGHYERTGVASRANRADNYLTDPELLEFAGISLGGRKDRMNQWCSAMGRVQLKYYPERIAEIDKAMNYFGDLIDGIAGLKMHRPPAGSGCTKGGWYFPLCHYDPDKMQGVSPQKFCEAVLAEGIAVCGAGANFPLHLHPVFHKADIFNMGKPTMTSFDQRDVRQGPGSLPVSEALGKRILQVPRFTTFDREAIELHAAAFRKIVENLDELK